MARSQRFHSPGLYPFVREIPIFPFEKGSLPQKDLRLAILDTFLNTLHERLEVLQALHNRILIRDPLFYGHLAAWYSQHGEVRAHKEIFLAHLLSSDLAEHREAAFILVQGFAPNEVSRMVDYCKRVLNKFPRSARTAVVRYLRAREAHPRWFDAGVLKGKKYLKHLYSSLRIKPDERAQRILFLKDPPPGSLQEILRRLSGEHDPAVQAQIILENRIPFHEGISSLREIVPSLAILLINAMSKEELRDCLNALKNRGALKTYEVKAIVDEKLFDTVEIPRESHPLRQGRIGKPLEILEELEMNVEAVISDCLQRNITIKKPTALFIDKSGSMDIATNGGKVLATLCASIAEDQFYVYLFDNTATPLDRKVSLLQGMEEALKIIVPEGSTSIGAPLEAMMERRERVEQILVYTDGNENAAPFFTDMYRQYKDELMVSPHVVIVTIGHPNHTFDRILTSRKIKHSILDFTHNSLQDLAAVLSLSSHSRLLEEILATALPQRQFTRSALI